MRLGKFPLMNADNFIRLVKEIVAEEYSVTVKDLESQSRKQPVAWIRQVGMWACVQFPVEVFGRPFKRARWEDISKGFSKGNHGTAVYASRVVEDARDVYPNVRRETDAILQKIQAKIAGPI